MKYMSEDHFKASLRAWRPTEPYMRPINPSDVAMHPGTVHISFRDPGPGAHREHAKARAKYLREHPKINPAPQTNWDRYMDALAKE